MKIRHIAGLVVIAGATLAAALTGSNANASTSACAHSVYGTACGAVTDVESGQAAESFDAFHQGLAYNQPIIGYFNAPGDKAVDMLTLKQSAANTVIFEYAPNGVASGLCLSEPFKSAGVVERPCNTLGWQTFTKVAVVPVQDASNNVVGYAVSTAKLPSGDALVLNPTGSFFVLVNSKTGDVVTFKGLRAQVVGVADPGAVGAGNTVGLYSASQVFAS